MSTINESLVIWLQTSGDFVNFDHTERDWTFLIFYCIFYTILNTFLWTLGHYFYFSNQVPLKFWYHQSKKKR